MDSSRHIGNVGESSAISSLTRNGWNVSFPLSENNPYDLIVEKKGELATVQVKATTYERPEARPESYMVELRDQSWNTEGVNREKMMNKNFDFLFVWTPENNYMIPSEKVGGNRGITVHPDGKYSRFLI